jgi:hypothetical protein
MFQYLGEKKETTTLLGPIETANLNHCLRLALSERPNRVVVSLPSSKDGKRTGFRDLVFYIYSEILAMNKVRIPSNSLCIVARILQIVLVSVSLSLTTEDTRV